MMFMNVPRLRRFAWFITILLWAASFYGTHLPAPRLPVVAVQDKTIHFIAFFGVGVALFWAMRLAKPARRELGATVLGILLVYAAIDEWTQPLAGRSCELADWYADAAGAAAAVVVCSAVVWIRGARE